MTTRAYIVPAVGDGLDADTAFRPAYVDGMRWAALTFGAVSPPVFMVAAEGTDAEHAAVAARTPIVLLPAAGPEIVDEAAAAVLAAELGTFGIPGLVAAGKPAVAVLRELAAWFLLAQRFAGLYGSPIVPGGIDLGAPFAALSPDYREQLVQAAGSLGIDPAGASDDATLRQFLQNAVALWSEPLTIGPMVL